MWLSLLKGEMATPFVDIVEIPAQDIGLYTDASGDPELGWGAYFDGEWSQGYWTRQFIKDCAPLSAWLELYAVVLAVVLWGEKFVSHRILIHCDNTGVCGIINKQTSPE